MTTCLTILMLLSQPALSPAAAPSPTPTQGATLSVPEQLIAEAKKNERAYRRLATLTDEIGPRLAGSAALDQAIRWATRELESDGLQAVRAERVMVPNWRRGTEQFELLAPTRRTLHAVGLGNSVATPAKGLRAPLLVVHSFDELARRADEVPGKIVLYQYDWPAELAPFAAYEKVFPFRSRGASEAAKLGAKAVLVRSASSRSLQTPHTGGVFYRDWAPKIPAAAISAEDASLLERLAAQKPVRVMMRMRARMLKDVPSANVIAELRGRELPDELVLIGAHIDSWDNSPGAHDDGAGVVVTMEVMALLKRLGLQPRRTVRLVLFTNEENGMRGARGYFAAHGEEKHVAAIELDRGGGRPLGFSVEGTDQARRQVEQLAAPLVAIQAGAVRKGFGGVDLIPLTETGVPGIGLDVDASRYFEVHHSPADTLDKIDPAHLALQIASTATLTWQLAEADPALPRTPVQKAAGSK